MLLAHDYNRSSLLALDAQDVLFDAHLPGSWEDCCDYGDVFWRG